MRLRSIFDLLFFISALMLALSVRAHDFAFTGEARDIKTGMLLYTEEHFVSLAKDGDYQKSLVRYVAPDGELIANKSLDFGASQFAPMLSFKYHAYPLEYDASYQNDTFVLATNSPSRESNEEIEPSAGQAFVVDGGFDRLLVKFWDQLLSGEERQFDFLAITRGSTIEFALSMVGQTDERVRFRIEPGSWIISLLLDPIFLEYDRESRLLMRYEGLTNIALSEGSDNVVAVIEYQYEEGSEVLALRGDNTNDSSLTVR